MNRKLEKYSKQIKAINHRKALGYERTLDFSYGYIEALIDNKFISRKEGNVLLKVYSNYENGDCRWIIENGKLMEYHENINDYK